MMETNRFFHFIETTRTGKVVFAVLVVLTVLVMLIVAAAVLLWENILKDCVSDEISV